MRSRDRAFKLSSVNKNANGVTATAGTERSVEVYCRWGGGGRRANGGLGKERKGAGAGGKGGGGMSPGGGNGKDAEGK